MHFLNLPHLSSLHRSASVPTKSQHIIYYNNFISTKNLTHFLQVFWWDFLNGMTQHKQACNFTTYLSWLLHLCHVRHLVCYLSWHLRHLAHWLTLNLTLQLTTHLSRQLHSHLGRNLTWTCNIWQGPWLHLPWHSNHLSNLQHADIWAVTTHLKLKCCLWNNKGTKYRCKIIEYSRLSNSTKT